MSILRLPLALCLNFAVAAGVAGPTHSQISEQPIKVEVITDMNGPLASATGRGSVEAARMAAEEFESPSAASPSEILSADHQNKPDIGAAIVRRWFDVGNVNAVADIANSAVEFAIVEIARPRNKIVLVGAGSSDFTGKACAPTSIHWTWDTYGASTGSVKAVFGPGADKWFFISSDFAFGHALERDGIAAVEKLGGTVVGHVRVPFGTSDFSSFLLQAQQSNASVIAFGTAGADTVNILKQAAEFRLAKPGVRVMPLQFMIDEVKAIGLELGQGNFALMAFHHDRSPEAKAMVSAIFRTCKIDADCNSSWHLFGGPSLFTGDQRCRHRRAPDGRREDARDARQRHVCNQRLPPRGRPDGSRHVPDPDQARRNRRIPGTW